MNKKLILAVLLSGVMAFGLNAAPRGGGLSLPKSNFSLPKSSVSSYKNSYKPYKSAYSAPSRSSGVYTTTGLPKVERSQSARREFLKQQGFSKNPSGFEVDHVVPLHRGGADTPSNMQLLSKEQHLQKTVTERRQDGSLFIHR